MPILLLCQFSLRDDVATEELPPSPAAKDGDTGHIVQGPLLMTGKDHPEAVKLLRTKAMRDVYEIFKPWSLAMHERFKKTLQIEIPAKYDFRENTATSLYLRSKREYELGPTEIATTCDIIYTDEEGVLCVDDMKLGHFAPPPAQDNEQMKTMGVVFGALRRVDKVRLRIIHKSDMSPTPYEMDKIDMDAHALRLREAFTDVSKAEPNPGPHCKYCPAVACPKDARKTEAA